MQYPNSTIFARDKHEKFGIDIHCKLCYKLYENLCGLFRAQANFSPHNAMRCVFLWQKPPVEKHEKVETFKRGGISCGNRAACFVRRYAHDIGIRAFNARCSRVYSKSYSRHRVRLCGIYRARHTHRFVLHYRKTIQSGIPLFVYILPFVRRNSYRLAKNPRFRHFDKSARKL